MTDKIKNLEVQLEAVRAKALEEVAARKSVLNKLYGNDARAKSIHERLRKISDERNSQ